MAGPIKGSIEHLFNGTGLGTGSVQSLFVNVYNFLNNNTGTLGIQRIAYHTGSKETGMVNLRGMNFYDEANPAGGNAWACFCFSSASVPTYVLIQHSNAVGMGGGAGTPGTFRAAATANAMGFAFASRADGGNPWNGSSGSNGQDTKGTPVWHPGTSSLAIAPRSNDGVRSGVHGASRQNLMGFTVATSTDYRLSMVADYDNFVVLFDGGITNAYSILLMSAYTPLSGVTAQAPWFALHDAALPLDAASAYGDLAGSAISNGGIGYPTLSISGTCTAGIDRYTSAGFFQNTSAQPNRAFATPRFDEFPIMAGLFETPNQVGATGQVYNFCREIYNVATHDTNVDGTRACFGSAVVATVKLTIPWHSGTVPGAGITRVGIPF